MNAAIIDARLTHTVHKTCILRSFTYGQHLSDRVTKSFTTDITPAISNQYITYWVG